MPILRRRENVRCPALPPLLEFVSKTNTRLNSNFPEDLFAGDFICSAEYLQADSTQIPSSKDNALGPGRRRLRDTRLVRLIEETAHRPWPVPESPWVLYMCWENLLFLHWPVPPEIIRPLIPPSIDLETFDGSCW